MDASWEFGRDADLPHENTLAMVVAWTVLLSVVAHGVTANPWASAFGARQSRLEYVAAAGSIAIVGERNKGRRFRVGPRR